MLDEKICLAAYDPKWAQVFKLESERLYTSLYTEAVVIEHIGSTAVPGLLAKPIIDIMIGLRSWDPLEIVTSELLKVRYECLGESGVPGRVYYRKRSNPSFNVHVVIQGSQLWHDNLLLRDYLSHHPVEAQKYSQLKQEAISRGMTTLLAYSDYKATTIHNLLVKARAEISE